MWNYNQEFSSFKGLLFFIFQHSETDKPQLAHDTISGISNYWRSPVSRVPEQTAEHPIAWEHDLLVTEPLPRTLWEEFLTANRCANRPLTTFQCADNRSPYKGMVRRGLLSLFEKEVISYKPCTLSNNVFIVCVCVCRGYTYVWASYAAVHMWRAEDNLQVWFSLSTRWVPGIKLRSSNLVAKAFYPRSYFISSGYTF